MFAWLWITDSVGFYMSFYISWLLILRSAFDHSSLGFVHPGLSVEVRSSKIILQFPNYSIPRTWGVFACCYWHFWNNYVLILPRMGLKAFFESYLKVASSEDKDQYEVIFHHELTSAREPLEIKKYYTFTPFYSANLQHCSFTILRIKWKWNSNSSLRWNYMCSTLVIYWEIYIAQQITNPIVDSYFNLDYIDYFYFKSSLL